MNFDSNKERPKEMKTLAKNTMILVSPKLLNFVVGILKSKFIAVFLGTTGFGIIGQLTNTINQIKRLTLSFLPDGMVKLIAQENAEEFNLSKISQIIKTYFLMIVPLAIFITALGYVFVDQITLYVLGDLEYRIYLKIALIAFPITVFSTTFRAFLKAFKEIKSFAIAEIAIVSINLILFIPLVYFYKIPGGVAYVTLSFMITLMVVFYLAKRNVFDKYNIRFSDVKNALFSQKYFKELLAFIGIGFMAGAFRVVVDVSTRAIVVNQLGIDQFGTYSPITKWGSLFISFILPSIFTYLYPRLSEARSDGEIVAVINYVIRLITFIILPFIFLGISTRQWVIPLLYSKEFMEATIYLPFHFAALLMVVWGTIFEQIFAPTGRLKIFLLFIIIISSLNLVLVYYFVPLYGLYGYLLKFTVTPLLTTLIFSIYWRYEIKFRLKKENIFILLYAIVSTLILVILRNSNNYLQIGLSVLFLGLAVFFMNSQEKEFVMKRINKILKRS